jgi:hypothetical protein
VSFTISMIDTMSLSSFARIAVAGTSLLVFGSASIATKNFAVLALAAPPIAILEWFLARAR